MKNPRRVKFVMISILITLLCFALAILAAGSGHGSFAVFILFFPHYMLFSLLTLAPVLLFKLTSIPTVLGVLSTLGTALVLVQNPAYAVLLSSASERNCVGQTIKKIAIAHIAAVIACALLIKFVGAPWAH